MAAAGLKPEYEVKQTNKKKTTSALRIWKVKGTPLRELPLRSNSFQGKLTGGGDWLRQETYFKQEQGWSVQTKIVTSGDKRLSKS